MSIDQKFLNLFIKATEKAAIGASKFIGKNDKIAADKGAVDPMRRELNKINMEGTIVIGEMVRLNPVALTHGSVSIRITDAAPGQITDVETGINVEEVENNQLYYLNPNETLSDLVDSLNSIGASPKDLISIIQALKESGALIGSIEII